MVQELLSSTLIAFASLSTTSLPQSSPLTSPHTGFALVKEATDDPVWVVREKESLGYIAETYYGDSAFWTNLWNDNPWIKNPSLIEPRWKLKLGDPSQNEPEPLLASLAARIHRPVSIASALPTTVGEHPTASQPTPAALPAASTSVPLNDAQITFLGNCESGMTATRNSGNGYYGAFQFSYGTWKSMGTTYERADLAPLDVQIDAVQRLLQRSSIFTQFPGCARKMRSVGLI